MHSSRSVMPGITVGLSLHRPEMVPIVAERMRRHAAVFLEEPGSPGFEGMLTGEIPIDDYLLPLDVEYPSFSRSMCCLMRELHADGKAIHQVEPFVEILIHIQEFFADGHRPDELVPGSLPYNVYRAEHAATGALLAYYQTAMTGSFEDAVQAVIRFARADAARFRLRDSLRSQELARLLPRYSSSYVEAGLMHCQLWRRLRRLVAPSSRVRPVFLAQAALPFHGEGRNLYGPGDRLTLQYIFHPAASNPRREELLAARSMIYSKILNKPEAEDDGSPFPHLRDELACIAAVRRLSLEDCRRWFPLIRRSGSSEARRRLTDFTRKDSERGFFERGQPRSLKAT